MSSFSGMDISEVRALARQMQGEAAEVSSMVQRLTAEMQSVPWRGQDRDRFLDEWTSRHVAGLKRVADGLQQASRDANEYARRQEWASRA